MSNLYIDIWAFLVYVLENSNISIFIIVLLSRLEFVCQFEACQQPYNNYRHFATQEIKNTKRTSKYECKRRLKSSRNRDPLWYISFGRIFMSVCLAIFRNGTKFFILTFVNVRSSVSHLTREFLCSMKANLQGILHLEVARVCALVLEG